MAHEFVFALSKAVPVTFKGPAGSAVAIEKTETTGSPCTEVAVRHEVPLTLGRHTLTFGPTAETSVGMVIEEVAHSHEEH
jgi:hypothetical protein